MSLDTDCWEWTGAKTAAGYGVSQWDGKVQYVHRVVADAPIDLVVDHLCRNRGCFNPRHLEVVTDWENRARGEAKAAVAMRDDTCWRGHALDAANTYLKANGMRNCKVCRRDAVRRYRERQHAHV